MVYIGFPLSSVSPSDTRVVCGTIALPGVRSTGLIVDSASVVVTDDIAIVG